MKKHIVVIGGGMAGCAAAYTLRKKGHHVTIIEKNSQLGGRMDSEKVGDLMFEMGAVFLTNFYTNVLGFLRDTGLDTDLQERKSETYIVRDGVPHSTAKVRTYIGDAWLSFGAKLRLVQEVFRLLPAWGKLSIHAMWKADAIDKNSVAESLSGKYGQEVLNYLFEPVLNGYMYWSPKKTSHAFLMILLKAALLQRHTYILKNGLRQIPERAAVGCEVLLSHEVQKVQLASDSSYTVRIAGPLGVQTLRADGIVCATTASAITGLFSDLTREQSAFFTSVSYSSTVVAAYRVQRSEPMATYAIAYPSVEEKPIVAMTVLSDTSEVASMVKIYASGTVGKSLAGKSDKELHNILSPPTQLDLTSALKSGEWRVQRWREAIPEFDVGHLQRLRTFANGDIEKRDAKLVFAGDYIGGPFVEGAFTSGQDAAERLHTQLLCG